jgi:secreted Zn-dependent insulinase-like peptidase
MRVKAQEIPDSEFETIKSAILVNLEQKDKKLAEEAMRLFNEVAEHRYQFDRKERMIAALKSITKQDWQQAMEHYIFSKQARRICMRWNSEAHKEQEE